MDRSLLQEIAVISTCYEDVKINNTELPLIFAGTNGLYLCAEEDMTEKQAEDIFCFFYKKSHLTRQQVFLFRFSDDVDTGSFYADDTFVEMDNIYEAFQNCYANHLIPQSDLFHITFENLVDYCKPVACDDHEELDAYVPVVISHQKLESIDKIFRNILTAPVEIDKTHRVYPDGHMEVKRTTTQSIAGVSTFLETGESYFPCMDMDGDKFFLLAFLGGWFGLHKFKTGNYLQGLFYLLTCGCCGVFYVFDLIYMLIGGYNYSIVTADRSRGTVDFQKQRFYARPISHQLAALGMIAVAIAISYFLVTHVYMSMLMHVNTSISAMLSETDFANKLLNLLTFE